MGQSDIVDFLEKHPHNQYTTYKIAEHLGMTVGSVQKAIGQLAKFRLINWQDGYIPGSLRPQRKYFAKDKNKLF